MFQLVLRTAELTIKVKKKANQQESLFILLNKILALAGLTPGKVDSADSEGLVMSKRPPARQGQGEALPWRSPGA